MLKKYALFIIAIIFSSFYTLLVIVAIDGLSRNGVIDKLCDYFKLLEPDYVMALILFGCVLINFLFFMFILKGRYCERIVNITILTLFIGLAIFLVLLKINIISKVLYDCYISFFYNGNYLDGEERVQQTMSFFVRYMALCFFSGGVISYFITSIRRK